MKLTSDQIDRLTELEKSGILTPDSVVEDATDPESVLHPLFEWNNDIAAHKYRVDQARTVISSVTVIVTSTTADVVVSAYVRDPSLHPAQGYRRITSAGAKEHRLEIAVREITQALAGLRRAQGIAEALGIDAGISEEVMSLEEWRGGIESLLSSAAD